MAEPCGMVTQALAGCVKCGILEMCGGDGTFMVCLPPNAGANLEGVIVALAGEFGFSITERSNNDKGCLEFILERKEVGEDGSEAESL